MLQTQTTTEKFHVQKTMFSFWLVHDIIGYKHKNFIQQTPSLFWICPLTVCCLGVLGIWSLLNKKHSIQFMVFALPPWGNYPNFQTVFMWITHCTTIQNQWRKTWAEKRFLSTSIQMNLKKWENTYLSTALSELICILNGGWSTISQGYNGVSFVPKLEEAKVGTCLFMKVNLVTVIFHVK